MAPHLAPGWETGPHSSPGIHGQSPLASNPVPWAAGDPAEPLLQPFLATSPLPCPSPAIVSPSSSPARQGGDYPLVGVQTCSCPPIHATPQRALSWGLEDGRAVDAVLGARGGGLQGGR